MERNKKLHVGQVVLKREDEVIFYESKWNNVAPNVSKIKIQRRNKVFGLWYTSNKIFHDI